MSNEKGKKRVRVFVPTTFEGVTSVAILEELTKGSDELELDIEYTGHLDFRDHQKFSDTDIILVIGLPYKGYALPAEFQLNVDVPFMDFIHAATYGEEIEGENIVSMVDPDKDPIKQIADFLTTLPYSSLLSKYVEFTDKAWYLIQAVNDYRTWNWENNSITRMLLALYQASHKWMPRLMRGLTLEEIIKRNAPVIQGQIEKMKDYIELKLKMTKRYNVVVEGQSCLLKVVFADQYINELANKLLTEEQTALPVIVCVGRPTKSNDMFSIRTTIVNAGKIAYMINEGGGKESVASVFTGISYAELMGNGIVTALAQGEE